MKEYLLVFRAPLTVGHGQAATQEQLEVSMEAWNKWIGGLAAQGKFKDGQPLTTEGRHMKTRTSITDAPLAEGKEVINGYLIIKAADYDEACSLSEACPIFDDGGSVEIREINPVVVDF